ncbi:MAG: hypothetical protein ACRDOM_08770, partial [Nocardioides sp.]
TPRPTPTVATDVPPYDPGLEPAQAVLTLVPLDATTLTLTDFDEVRRHLGVPDVTSADPMTDRIAFWERAAQESPLLAEGMLRPVNSELELDYGFTQDDVDWEAHFSGPGGNGFVLGVRPDLDLGAVRRAVEAGAGPLDGARVLAAHHLVVSGTAARGETVWAGDPAFEGLVGETAQATYVRRDCVPLETALGPDAGYEEQQDLLAKHPVTNLDELPAFSVTFGDHNATVRMEPTRDDLFDRLDLGRDWPVAAFGAAFRQAVGDPTTGRIGYDVPRPPQAAALTLLEELPFAVCNDVTPIAEPTGL